ncbi:type VI secretion protein [Labrys miyagiensis]|uniref:Type IV secretion system protein virB8 n=1 Tax=Labrys miyagiensis TaxID=346912 RepID=A0ABQ6CCP8_9HYPH|nr:type IV secretion system protein [Labrys miyagiensis]GLS18031.1 type VI secretion protein [Labrys miyagiensis]
MFKASAKSAQGSLIDSRYYTQGEAWEKSTYRMIKARGAVWRLTALLSMVANILLGLALMLLIPTQHTEVTVFEVDHTTGYLHLVQPLEETRALKDNEAVTASNIVQFINARETYDPHQIAFNNNKALLFSSAGAAADIKALWDSTNPKNPQRLYGQSGSVTVGIESLNFLNAETALVRFTTTVITQGGPPAGLTYYWSANVRFRTTNAPMRMDYRMVNPTGFQVTDYRRDQERVAPVVNKDAAP